MQLRKSQILAETSEEGLRTNASLDQARDHTWVFNYDEFNHLVRCERATVWSQDNKLEVEHRSTSFCNRLAMLATT